MLGCFKRLGFTMIELIFVIVIVGISILTIPLMIDRSQENLKKSADVSGYYHALTLMQILRVKPWDIKHRDQKDFETSNLYYILNTEESGYECDPDPLTGFNKRPGMASKEFRQRRFCYQGAVINASPLNGDDITSLSFASYTENVARFSTSDEYKLTALNEYVPSGIRPYYEADFATHITNTKRLKITLADNKGNDIATYFYYATNISTDIPITKRMK